MRRCSQVDLEDPSFLAGGVTGVLASRFFFGIPVFTLSDGVDNPIRAYHAALLMHLIYKGTGNHFVNGLSTSMLVMEGASANPFGLGLPISELYLNLVATAGILGLLAVAEGCK